MSQILCAYVTVVNPRYKYELICSDVRIPQHFISFDTVSYFHFKIHVHYPSIFFCKILRYATFFKLRQAVSLKLWSKLLPSDRYKIMSLNFVQEILNGIKTLSNMNGNLRHARLTSHRQ